MADSLPKRGGMSLTTKIVIGMAAGLITGTILNIIGSAGVNSWLVDGLFAMIGTAFVNGLKMLVVPLVVFSLLCGVLGIGDIRMLGRVGGKSFALYIATTAIATRSQAPLTECSARTPGIWRRASTTPGACFGNTVIMISARMRSRRSRLASFAATSRK